jgi:hypothetical protein
MKVHSTARFIIYGVCFSACGVMAQTATDVAVDSTSDTGIASFFVSLAEKYPWIATILLIIGALRVVFKPVMSLLDSYVKQNCSSDEYSKLQSFESGSIYKWLSFGLDMFGSVKLPVIVKTSQQDQTQK